MASLYPDAKSNERVTKGSMLWNDCPATNQAVSANTIQAADISNARRTPLDLHATQMDNSAQATASISMVNLHNPKRQISDIRTSVKMRRGSGRSRTINAATRMAR